MLNMVLLDTEKLPKKYLVQIEERLGGLGNLTCYLNTRADILVERCVDAEVILVNKEIISADHIKALPNLKYIVVIATGYDNVDVITAKQCGVMVSNIPNYSSITVAQHTISLLLELTNHVGNLTPQVKSGKWFGNQNKILELSGLTLGVFGFGNIARRVIAIALALGMNILVCSRDGRNAKYDTDLSVKFVDKEELLQNSDVITLHCLVNEDTRNIINKDSINLMKPTCLLINTSRGALIDEDDLYHALLSKKIAGVALDVLKEEPPKVDNPLFTLDNCVFTPHNAWVSDASLTRWMDEIEACVLNYTKNKFINLV
jgi:glycerate dehydrogenase